MSIVRPIVDPIVRPIVGPFGGGLPWDGDTTPKDDPRAVTTEAREPITTEGGDSLSTES